MKKLTKFFKGHIPWNKNKKLNPISEEHKRKISEANKGKKPYVMTDEIKNKMSNAKLGKPSWNKGTKGKGICKPNSGSFKKGIPNNVGKDNPMFGRTMEQHHLWKGEKASYGVKHSLVYRYKGKAKNCEHCGDKQKNKRFHWANVDHKYSRDINDYIALCVPCHKRYDKALHI